MVALFLQFALFNDQNIVGVFHTGELMGDNQQGLVGHQGIDGLLAIV